MASVFKRGKKHGGKGRKLGQVYYAAWTDHTGKRHNKSTRTTDKAAADLIAARFAAESALRREGVVDPSDDRYAVEGRRPIAQQLTDYVASLKAQRRDDEYITQTEARAKKVIGLCHADRPSCLTASAVQRAIGQLRDAGKSLSTCNSYLRSIKGFTSWLYADKRIRRDALEQLAGYNEQEEKRRQRRELTSDELVRLISATISYTDPVRHSLSGPDRAMLYHVALGTGFRAGELRSLTTDSFNLDSDPPTITVAATHSKRRRTDVQPIHRRLADMLRDWLANKPIGQAVFAKMPGGTARMLRADLAAARKAWIDEAGNDPKERERREKSDFLAYRNSAGEVFDFHATRHAYISSIVNSGASVKVAQELARHSTPVLTIGRYAHTRLNDLCGALDYVPTIGNESADNAQTTQRETLRIGATNGNEASLVETAQGTGGMLTAYRKLLRRTKLKEAEGTGLEPATPCGAPHFQCGR